MLFARLVGQWRDRCAVHLRDELRGPDQCTLDRVSLQILEPRMQQPPNARTDHRVGYVPLLGPIDGVPCRDAHDSFLRRRLAASSRSLRRCTPAPISPPSTYAPAATMAS